VQTELLSLASVARSIPLALKLSSEHGRILSKSYLSVLVSRNGLCQVIGRASERTLVCCQ